MFTTRLLFPKLNMVNCASNHHNLLALIAIQSSLVNDRAGKNHARPNRAGSVIFTEGSAGGSAEPQAKSSQNWHNFGTKFWYFFSSEKRVSFSFIQNLREIELANSETQNLPFRHIQRLRILNFVKFCTFLKTEIDQINKIQSPKKW